MSLHSTARWRLGSISDTSAAARVSFGVSAKPCAMSFISAAPLHRWLRLRCSLVAGWSAARLSISRIRCLTSGVAPSRSLPSRRRLSCMLGGAISCSRFRSTFPCSPLFSWRLRFGSKDSGEDMHRYANKSMETNSRPACSLAAGEEFERSFSARSSLPATVAHLFR